MSFASVVKRLRTLENPYPGLRPFETEESHLFFGRDQQVAELVGRLERNRLVAVVGVSGSGKSSLVRAGLIPALERVHLSDAGRRWRMVVTRPAGAPFDRLAADLGHAGLDASGLADSSHGLIETARQLPADESLLVVVDQFEELFRYKEAVLRSDDGRRRHDASAAEAAEFVQLLLASSRYQPPVYVVLTMRSDYLGDCAEFRDLPEALNDCQYLIPRMTREQRKEAIEGPLGRTEIAPVLVQRLLNDAGDEPDQLPVLQHALMRTWNHWHRADPDQTRRIELQNYEAIGGLANALDQHADELLAGVPTEITAAIFRRLTAKGRGSRERRNPARLAELWGVCGAVTPERQARVTAVVDHFRRGEATFLVPRDGVIGADSYIDITHESLIRQWKRLRDDWLPDELKSAKTFLDLTERARNFNARKGELLIGLDLADAVEWDRRRNPTDTWAAHYASEGEIGKVLAFIRASDEQTRQRKVRQRWERRRLRIAVTVAALAIVGALGIYGYDQYTIQVNEVREARDASRRSLIASMPLVRNPYLRALLLAELAEAARPEHLAIYQEAAAAAIPFAALQYPDNEQVVGAGFLRDGKAAVAVADGTLWSWRSDGHGDRQKGDIVEFANRALPSLTATAFSPDGQWIAAGLASGAVWVGRSDRSPGSNPIAAAEATRSPDGVTMSALAFSRDGRQLAAAGSDYRVRIWRLDGTSEGLMEKAVIEIAQANAAPILSVDFDEAGRRIVTGSWDGDTRVWSLDARAKRSVTFRGDDPVARVAFSPDGAWVLSGYLSGDIQIRRSTPSASTEPLVLPHAAELTFAAFSPDGLKVVAAYADRTAQVWAIRHREGSVEPVSLEGVGSPTILTHDARVSAAVFSQDGTKILTASADGAARLWWSDQREPRILGFHEGRVESVAFSSDGKYVVSASDDRTARIWSLDGAPQPERLAGHNDWVRSAAFSPDDGRKLVTASEDGTLRLWDLAVPGASKVSQEGESVFAAAFDRAGERVVTAVRDNTARVWKRSSLARGDRLGTSDPSEVVELRHSDWVLGAAFSSDGSKIVTASRDGTVRIWAPDRSANDPMKLFVHPQATTVFSAAFSPDGKRIVTASADGVARILAWEGSDEPVELRHAQEVNKAVFSSRGEWIVTASKDGTAGLWSAADGRQRVVLDHGAEWVRTAAFDSADARVVTGTADGVVRLWRITLPALKSYLRQATTACIGPRARVQFLGESDREARSRYETCEGLYERTPAGQPRPAGNATAAGPSQR